MKRIKSFAALVTAVFLIMAISACENNSAENKSLWDSAIYVEDKEFGEGEKSFFLEVKTDEKSVTFTVNTDAENLEDALVEHKLIDGDKGPYGLYVKKVNGITADYDIDQSYWSLSENNNPLQTGASGVEISGGEHFEFTYTK